MILPLDWMREAFSERWMIQRSADQFLTTHTGSLPRPDRLMRMNQGRHIASIAAQFVRGGA